MISKLLIVGGTWLVSDAIYSITLYINATSYGGKKQTWRRDHWIRLLRLFWGLFFIIAGFIGG